MYIGMWICVAILLSVSLEANGIMIRSISKKYQDLLKEHTELKSMLRDLCIKASMGNVSTALQHKNNIVAFTAILNRTITLGQEQTVPYENVLMNIGNAYSTKNYHFTAPLGGVYSFSVSMMGHHSNGIHLQLMKDHEELVRLWTHGGGRHELSSQTINIYLTKGDSVWVQRHLQTGGILYGGGEPYNVFSGALLSAA